MPLQDLVRQPWQSRAGSSTGTFGHYAGGRPTLQQMSTMTVAPGAIPIGFQMVSQDFLTRNEGSYVSQTNNTAKHLLDAPQDEPGRPAKRNGQASSSDYSNIEQVNGHGTQVPSLQPFPVHTVIPHTTTLEFDDHANQFLDPALSNNALTPNANVSMSQHLPQPVAKSDAGGEKKSMNVH